jgi:hypothetical protein
MMMKTLKVKLSLLMVLSALMVPAISIPAQAGTNVERIHISSTLGYALYPLSKVTNTNQLQFTASARTGHKDYDDIALELLYGRPYITNGISKCEYIGDADKKLSKSEMDAKGEIKLRLSYELPADKAYCIYITASVSNRVNVLPINENLRKTLYSETRVILWDPNNQFDNWLPSTEQLVVSIGYASGDKNNIRFHGIGKSNKKNLNYYLLDGDITEEERVVVEQFSDEQKEKNKFAQFESKRKLSANKRYRLMMSTDDSYYDYDKKENMLERKGFTLYWDPPVNKFIRVDVPLK